MNINEVDFDLIENKPFGRLRWGNIIGIVDSYGAVHSEINTELWHEDLWPTAKCKWRWNHDRSIWWIAAESKPDDEQYESIMHHLEKKYGIKFWENGHHDIDHLMKMWIKEHKNAKLTKREKELLETLKQEPSGRLTKEMACFLLQTTPQAIGRLAMSLTSKNLAYRDNQGTIYPS